MDWLAGGVLGRHQRHVVLRVGDQVDASDVALFLPVDRRAKLVALKQEVRAVVVVRVGARKALLEDEVRVLVRLSLLRLGWGSGLGSICGFVGSPALTVSFWYP